MAEILLATPDAMRESLRRLSKLKGMQADADALADVGQLIAPELLQRADLLIEHLHTLQDYYRALFERHLCALAKCMNLSMAYVYEVASFYHHFDVMADDVAPAELTVRVCDGLSCEIAGAQKLLADLPAALGAGVRVLGAPCIGQCEHAPAVAVGQSVVQSATLEKVIFKKNTPNVVDESALVASKIIAYDEYRESGGYALAAALVNGEEDVEQALHTMETAGLRGLGGAGFPAGRKWRIVREQAAPRLMAVNIDEGEPGTFKDRTYLERDPHRFLEGMLIAAQVVGCEAISFICVTNTTIAANCSRKSWRLCKPTRLARCPISSCGEGLVLIFAAKSPP